MTKKNSNRGSRKKTLRFTILVIVMLLLCVEAGVLLSLRGLFPGGIAPVVVLSDETETLLSDPNGKWSAFDESTLSEIRSVIERDLAVSDGESPEDIALLLRNWTRLKAVGETGRSLDTEDPCVILEHFESGNDFYCKPLADLYAAALASYGINARRLAIYAEVGDFKRAHSTVEVWNGEKWVLQDPTFNAYAVGLSGEILSAGEIQTSYESGETVRWIQDASDTEPKIESYHVPIEDLYSVIFYRLHGPRYEQSRLVYRMQRFMDRITGRTDSIIRTRERLPVVNYVANGTVDRYLLLSVFILILISVFIELKRV